MDILTIDTIKELVDVNSDIFISIYFPTFRSGVDVKQNPVRLKQLLRVAEDKLFSMGLDKSEIKSLLVPANNLIDDTRFWQNQSDGFALFIHSDGMKYYRVPFEFKESITVSNKLHIKPLLPLLTGNGQFFILALSKGSVRFFRASRQNIIEVELEKAPDSAFDMQVDDDYEHHQNLRFSNPTPRNSLSYNTVTQSQGNEDDYEKNELTRYFRAIDVSIMNMFEGENIPLVLAGVEYLIPIYREKSNYPNIVDDYIRGNPEMLNGNELHVLAWEIVEPIFNESQKIAEEKFKQFHGQGNKLYSTSLKTIIPAAYSGQIESLFIDSEAHKWGRFDHNNNKLILHEDEKDGDEDLIEYASILTLSRGGKVYSVDSDKVPEGGEVAAVMRY